MNIEIVDNIIHLSKLWQVLKRQKNEFLPCEELDLYETGTSVLEEAIDLIVKRLEELVEEY